ncbi:MAG: RNA polymerase sigma factor SigY [Bacillus sp. (in: firmicutes)]
MERSNEMEYEQTLIAAAQDGDEAAFSELFHMNYAFLYKYIVKMTCNPSVVDDLLQDTMLKCYLNIKIYDNRSKFTSWLITIATRTYIDYLRKRKREKWLFRKAEQHCSDSMKWQIHKQGIEFNEVMEVISKLDAAYRIPLLLKHYYGFSYGEIAAMIDIKEGTVKSRVHKCVQLIRKELNDFEERYGKQDS